MLFILLCCCLAALCQDVLGEGECHIKNATGLIEFSKNVSSGTNYKGTTVFLGADINFSGGLSEQFEPLERVTATISEGHLMDKGTQSATLQ